MVSFNHGLKKIQSQLLVTIISVWKPIFTPIGEGTLNFVQTYQFNIENIIPDTATQVLIYARTHCGNTKQPAAVFADVSVFVNIDGMLLSKYLLVIGYAQDAYNTNSDNMWFPVSSTKTIHVDSPRPIPGICEFRLTAIGYC